MFTAQWFSLGGMRCSPLNAALVANEKNGAKTKCLGLRSSVFCSVFVFQLLVVLVCENRTLVSFVVEYYVSETDLFVESQLGDIVFSNKLFGVVRLYSTVLFVPSGFNDRRFETASDLSLPKHVKLVLAKRQSTSNQIFRFGN
ncbi:TPA: hypothetical protein ACN35J_004551 [Vibrio parahaemolyticus]|nr:hypothetical protein [Vibrio parahaemolyticus]